MILISQPTALLHFTVKPMIASRYGFGARCRDCCLQKAGYIDENSTAERPGLEVKERIEIPSYGIESFKIATEIL